ncbi:transglycosylase SLT domain-containing protein [Streptacidiphilus cavernicola]|uniref:Transglycosylase SLT domain-containing protein n=1 Tax=Streptacidiphilus cavernicola TaxID=3342716 RepID=A0ABV6W414_9ACTN
MRFHARTSAGVAAYIVLASTMAAGTAFAASGPSHPQPTAHTVSQDAAAPAAAKPVVPVAPAKPAAKAPAAPAKPAAPAAKPAPAKPVYPNNLNGWIAEARQVLAQHGDRVPSASAIHARAMTESSGNPRAENHWDSNEALYGGTFGLLQTIKPTFAQWSLPGHKDILDPVDSIIAGVRYANDRYGTFETIAYTKAGY